MRAAAGSGGGRSQMNARASTRKTPDSRPQLVADFAILAGVPSEQAEDRAEDRGRRSSRSRRPDAGWARVRRRRARRSTRSTRASDAEDVVAPRVGVEERMREHLEERSIDEAAEEDEAEEEEEAAPSRRRPHGTRDAEAWRAARLLAEGVRAVNGRTAGSVRMTRCKEVRRRHLCAAWRTRRER